MSDQAQSEKSVGKVVVLGVQHMFVMFGATVLVPILTGLDIGVTLLAAGVGTLLFHLLTKFKVPVFLGSSFAFIPPLIALSVNNGGPGIEYALGGIVIAGGLYVIVAIIFNFVSIDVLRKILPAHITGPVIILIGIILAPVAILNSVDAYVGSVQSQIGVLGCWGVALFTFAVGILVKVGFPKWRMKFLSLLPVLIALVAGYILAVILGVVDFSALKAAKWFGLPNFSFPKFSWSAISFVVPIAVVTIVEHFGDILAIGNVVGEDFLEDPKISRTLLGDGLATSLSAMFGGPANTTYSENTGAVALTGVKNPAVMRIAAICAIILALIPKFNGVVGTIPAPVIGGISILLFGMISAVGVKNMVDARVDMGNPKVLIIVAVMMVLGLGTGAIGQLTNGNGIPFGAPFTAGSAISFGNFSFGGLGLAAIVGILLNVIINFESFKKS